MPEEFEFVPLPSDPVVPAEVPVVPVVVPEFVVPPEEAPLKRRIKARGQGLLKAVRHVVINDDPRHDRTPLERMARRWLESDLNKFMLRYEKMENEEAERLGTAKGEDEPDMGHDAACKVLDRLLKEAAK